MKTSSCKAKGRRAAQETKDMLLKYAPDLKPDDILVTSSGVTGEDLVLSPAAQEIMPYTFECKNVEKLNVWDGLKQAASHALKKPQAIPLLVFRRNRSDLYVALKLEDFLKLTR